MSSTSAGAPICDDPRLLASADHSLVLPAAGVATPVAGGASAAAVLDRTTADALLTLRLPETARREFSAADGTRWCVHERDTSRMLGARGTRCLVFETANVLRVVWSYPRDWRTLPSAELESLSNAR